MNDDDHGNGSWFGIMVGLLFVIPAWLLFIWWFWT